MLTQMRNFIVPANDPDEERRRGLVRILAVGFFVLSVIIVGVVTFYFVFINQKAFSQRDNQLLFISAVTAIIFSIVVYYTNKQSSRLASFLLLALLVMASMFSDTPQQLANGRSLFVFTFPIAIASLLLTPASSFLFAFVNSIIVIYLARVANVNPNVIAIIGFFLLALISWLAARTVVQALRELRTINAELDQRVTDRTRQLSESLARESTTASEREAILNSIADGVIVFNKEWNAILANPAIRSIFDMPKELVVGRSFRNIVANGSFSSKSVRLLDAMIENDTQPLGFRVEWGNKTLSVSAAQVYDGQGKHIGIVTVFRDVTSEAQLEKMKDSFLAIVSHELRTPLNAILGFSEMIADGVYGPPTQGQVKATTRIMENTKRVLLLVSELLDQAQIQSGRMRIQLENCKPSELLGALQSTLEKIASDKGIQLFTHLDPNMPEVLMGDFRRLQQIMINLANNAIKFTDKGDQVKVSINRQDNHWQIQVEDTGEGIPSDALTYIFDSFRQVEAAATRTHSGVGLGLSIVRQLAELMNGNVEVESQVGIGSKFIVTLPLVVTD
jgi:PAS domain S-box-containing protein